MENGDGVNMMNVLNLANNLKNSLKNRENQQWNKNFGLKRKRRRILIEKG